MATEREKGMLGKILGQIPDGVGVVDVRLPDAAGEPATVRYGGKVYHFFPNSSGSLSFSQVTPDDSVPEEENPCR